MEFKIEKGVPLPKPRQNIKALPLSKMEVGDSIFLPGKKSTNGANGSLSHWSRKLGAKFTQRKATVDGVDGVRIWRVA